MTSRANHYRTLRAGSRPQVEIEIKRSRFLGYAARVETEEAARGFLAEIRRLHREARHVCHGFVIGADREIQRSSDDGEPSGTAGMPILKAIVSRQTDPDGGTELSDVVVAVVRYFGGVKLGAGGLVQAYSDTAAATLDAARLVRRQRMRELLVQLPMADVGRIETTLRAQGVPVSPANYRAAEAELPIAVIDESDALDEAKERLAALSAGHGVITLGELRWVDVEQP